MPITYSDDVPADPQMREWWYNSLDAAVTYSIHEVLSDNPAAQEIYAFERALQGPALDMMLRGFRIDPIWKNRTIRSLEKMEAFIEERLDRLAHAVWGKSLNPRSTQQLQEFLYGALNLPEQTISVKGVRRVSTGREALERLDDYYIARPILSCVFVARETRKQLGVLKTGVDPDGRMRCTYNVCGTETGRWASSRNVYNRGTNLQNITENLRRMFIADPGYILIYIDGEQAESRSVGFILGTKHNDWRYLDACESGDLHTTVTKLVWPDLPWTGDNSLDREIADRVFYRWFSFRDMAKRGGHGTNYFGKDYTMARHLKVPVELISRFQKTYIPAFGMQTWWNGINKQLMTSQSITTFLGRERTFFGRANDDSIFRKAVAYEPQSTVGDLVNEGGYRVWKKFPEAQVLAQIHDAYLFQIPETRQDLIPSILSTFEVPVTIGGRTLRIPAEAMVGWNWSKEDPKRKTFSDGNPDGLRKWKGPDQRRRVERPEASLLDRVLY
jgi:DNA polymerase I